MNSEAELDLSNYNANFTKVAKTSEIPVGKMKMVKIKDKEILIANVNGKFHAISNPCTHKGGSLSEGSLVGNIVTCPLHGSTFDVTTGKSIIGSKGSFYRSSTGNATLYELKVDGEDILLYQKSAWGM